MTTIYALDLFGVVVFAITGSLAAGKKRLDLFGVVVLALATALGGGTLRDLTLRDVTLDALPVFWVADPTYVIVAAVTALATFVIVRCWRLPGGVLAGGMIRDVLSGEIPLILRREIYATASLCGAIVFAALSWRFPDAAANTVVAVAVILAIRLAALKWGLSLPTFSPRESADRDGN